METFFNSIKESTLKEIRASELIFDIKLIGVVGGYQMNVSLGKNTSTLVTARGSIRLFTLENASKFLHELGILEFYVDVKDFVPGRIRKARPDRALAMALARSGLKQQSLL